MISLKRHVLVIEDEQAIAQLLRMNLTEDGFAVDVASSAEEAWAQLDDKPYALCLLDWMLPGVQGIDFLKRARSQKRNIKILMLTAKADSNSIVQALEAGADDYVTKPFDSQVLAARIRNLVRRMEFEEQLQQAGTEKPNVQDLEYMDLDGLSMHFTKYLLSIDDQEVHLTPSEFKLLESLIKAQGQVLTREKLISLIQGEDVNVTGRTIDTHVFALRKKLGRWADHIETIRGVGYRILISHLDRSEANQDA